MRNFITAILFLLPFASFAISPITGTPFVCAHDITHLSDATAGGTWSSGNTAVASVDGSGNVLGVSVGTATITYATGAGNATLSITVIPGISSITGANDLCFGTTQAFSDSTAGGAWTSSNTLVATVVPVSGFVTAVSQGSAVISYTVGSCYATKMVSVSAPPVSLVGCDNVGVGDSLAFTGVTPGVTYLSSSDNTIASFDFPSGKVYGVSEGAASITYVNPTTGCTVATRDISVTASTLIQPISGNILVCAGSNSALGDAVAGGIWKSNNLAVATITSGGVATAVSGGATIISYSLPLPGGDTATCTTPFYTNSVPSSISGPNVVCATDTIVLNANTGGTRLAPADISFGEWYYYGALPTGLTPPKDGLFSSSNLGVATVVANIYPGTGVTTTGYIKGISGGVPNIIFTDNYTGCTVTKTITVNPLPVVPAITGPSSVCVGSSIILSNAVAGGIWNSTIPTIATLNAITGEVTGASLGVDTIKYYVTNSCGTTIVSKVITVSGSIPAVPGPITGQGAVCVGSSISMHDTTAGGTWSSSTPSVGTIDPATGAVTPVFPGSTLIIYTVTNSCGSNYITRSISVNPVPAGITGTTNTCVGTATTLHNTVAGGTWSSGSVWIANIVPASGLLTGIATGTAVITYTVGTALCSTTTTVTVNPLPAVFAVTGGGSYCSGGGGEHITLSGSASGANYQLYRYGVATGGTVAGTGTVLDLGVQTLAGVYTAAATNPSTGCTSNMSGSATITVNPLPTPYLVTGGGSYCTGGTGYHIFMVASYPGISYQLYFGPTPMGLPVAGTGSALDFGVHTGAGSYTVFATNTLTGCTNTMAGSATITINPAPNVYPITGGGGYCTGGSGVHLGLDSSNTGIHYQLFHAGTAVGGFLTGINAPLDFGLETVAGTYTVRATNATTTCSVNMSGTDTVSINPLPTVYPLTGGGSYCAGGAGFHILLGGSHAGVKYQLYRGVTAVGGALNGTGTLLDYGLQTAAGGYTVVATDTTTGCTKNMLGTSTISINPGPTVFAMTGGGGYCAGGDGVSIGLAGSEVGTQYQLVYGSTSSGIPAIGTGGPINFGLETGSGSYTVIASDTATTCSNNMSGSETVVVNISPSVITGYDTLTQGGTTTLMDSVTGGTWSSANTTIATVGATSGIVYGDTLGRDTIIYTLSTGCSAMIVVTVDEAVPPVIDTVSGVRQLSLVGTINVFPNPTSGELTVSWERAAGGDALLMITDMAGREVYKSEMNLSPGSGQKQVDLATLSDGVYVITLRSDTIHFSGKLMIRR